MAKSNFFSPDGVIAGHVPMEVTNFRMLGAPAPAAAGAPEDGDAAADDGTATATAAEASPFASLGYAPNAYRAYVEFDICHSLPNVIGPVQEGAYVGYTPDTLAASHASLLHQQMNIRHLLKAYAPDRITRDRIIGCVVATWFPKTPFGGWKLPASGETAPCIKACAVVFKLAEGVPAILGKHIASREKQSVSIESITTYNNIGLWLASRPDAIVPLMDPGELESAIGQDADGRLQIGKFNGEQVVMVYGLNGRPVDLRGVGVTPRPAERIARITDVRAEECERALVGTEFEGGDLHAIAAESHAAVGAATLIGQSVKFSTGRTGKVVGVTSEGTARLGGIRMPASAECPVLDFQLPDKRHVLMRLSDVAERLKD